MMSNELNIDKIGNQLNLAWDDKRVIKEKKSEKDFVTMLLKQGCPRKAV